MASCFEGSISVADWWLANAFVLGITDGSSYKVGRAMQSVSGLILFVCAKTTLKEGSESAVVVRAAIARLDFKRVRSGCKEASERA